MGSDCAVGRQALETIFFSVSDHQELEHSELEHCPAVRPAETQARRTAEARSMTGRKAIRAAEEKSREDGMSKLSRRSVLRGSVGLAAIGTLARPFIANAADKTASVWWTQGFVPEEDASFRAMVAEYEKTSGNKIDLSIIPFAP